LRTPVVRSAGFKQEIAAEYEQFLVDVETTQQAQLPILRRLIREHGLRHVYLEGITRQFSETPAVLRLREFDERTKRDRMAEIAALRNQLSDEVRGAEVLDVLLNDCLSELKQHRIDLTR
jgi:hypothetical protein